MYYNSFGQDFALDISAGATVQVYQTISSYSPDDYLQLSQPSHLPGGRLEKVPSFTVYQVAGQYKIKRFFALGASVSYGNQGFKQSYPFLTTLDYENPDGRVRVRGRNGFTLWDIGLNARLDALWKNDYEALYAIVGISFNRMINKLDETAIGTYNGSEVYNELDWKQSYHSLKAVIGLEWRDYFSPHFGYFLRVAYSPLHKMKASAITFNRLRINGNAHPLEGERISFSDPDYLGHTNRLFAATFNLGVTYQF